MKWHAPVLVLSGLLEPAGRHCRELLSSAEAARAARLAGWSALADQCLTLRDIADLPSRRWSEVACLGTWRSPPTAPDGDPGPYGGVAFAGTAARRVLLRRGAGPDRAGRLALLAEVDLRRALAVRDGDRVHLAIHEPAAWHELPPWGYHHMCG